MKVNHPRCPTPDVSRATCFLCRCSPPPPLTMLRERGVIEGPLALSPPSGRWVGDGQRARSVCLFLLFFLSFFLFFFSLSFSPASPLPTPLSSPSVCLSNNFFLPLTFSFLFSSYPPPPSSLSQVGSLRFCRRARGKAPCPPARFVHAAASLLRGGPCHTSRRMEVGGGEGGGRERKGLWR